MGTSPHGQLPPDLMRALLMALPSNEVDLQVLLPDVWIAAHPCTY
jgi:hypothetical protein